MTIEKTFQGAWRISTIHNEYLVTRQYFFCSKREAVAEFKEELNKG